MRKVATTEEEEMSRIFLHLKKLLLFLKFHLTFLYTAVMTKVQRIRSVDQAWPGLMSAKSLNFEHSFEKYSFSSSQRRNLFSI